MPRVATRNSVGRYANNLALEDFWGLQGQLLTWRRETGTQDWERERNEGRILGFVKGLRFSANLIYLLRKRLSEKKVEVDWGHLLDDEGRYCSPECDIIIHKPGCFQRWNGGAFPVMDFKFIRSCESYAVISCKSFANRIDCSYVKNVRPFQKNVILFAECCNPTRLPALQKQARRVGYKGFWCLYTWSPEKPDTGTIDEKQLSAFLASVDALVE